MEQQQIFEELPQNIDAEISVLGSLIIDASKIGTVQSILIEEDFFKTRHQIIYRAIEAILERNTVIDLLTLANQLQSMDQLDNAGGYEYLVSLVERTPSSANVEEYSNIVKEKSTLRQLIRASQQISQQAYQENQSVAEIVDQSERLILSIGEGSQTNRPVLIKSLMGEAYDRVVKLSEEKREITGVPSGYIELDRLTSGFQPDQFIIIAARPAVGKTAFALNIAQNVATKSKIPVVIFSLEMGSLDLVNRMICAEGNINASNLRVGQLTDDEWHSFTIATDTLKDAPIYIDDTAGTRVAEIRAKCRRLKQENPDLGLIVIDYLQLIEGSGQENRQQEVSTISRQLKTLAKELEVPVIALSQLSRGLEQRQNKRPILSDIRESGSIEQDADIVAFLYREDYHQQEGDEETERNDELPDNTVEVILAKNRSGARGNVSLLFKKEYNKFSSMSYVPVS